MKHVSIILTVALLVACLPKQAVARKKGNPISITTVETGNNTQKSAQVDTLFSEWVRNNSPGAAVLIMKDGKVLHQRGYGLANLEAKNPITPETAFLLASLTKPFTAMAIAILREQGKLNFNDPLAKFFPLFPAYAQKITIRHLLTHTSGLPDYEALFIEKGVVDKDWPRSAKSSPSRFEPTSKDALTLLAQQQRLHFEPGEKFEYSNSGYVVLGQIVEKVSGQTFARFLKERIFKPLEMNNSVLYDETRPQIANRATSYAEKKEGYLDIDYTPLNLIYGEDNIYTTIVDLAKWVQALNTERLVKRSTLKEAFSPAALNDGTKINYGLGWYVGTTLGMKHVAHSGSWLGFRTMFKMYPDENFSVTVLSNSDKLPIVDATYKISKLYLGKHMIMPDAVRLGPEVLKKYVGTYRTDTGDHWSVTLDENHLWLNNDGPQIVKIIPTGEKKFFIEGREDIAVVFDIHASGRVMSLKMGSYSPAQKVP